jgi:hypothetical protein
MYKLCDMSAYIYCMDICSRKDRTIMSETWQKHMQLRNTLQKRWKEMTYAVYGDLVFVTWLIWWSDKMENQLLWDG